MTGGIIAGAGIALGSVVLPVPGIITIAGVIGSAVTSVIGILINDDPLEDLFKKMLDNRDVKLLSTEKKEYGEISYLNVPLGISDIDLDKYAKKLSEHYGKSVLLENEDGKVKCIVYEFGFSHDNIADMETGIQNAIKATCMYGQSEFVKYIKIYEKQDYNNGYILHIPYTPGISLGDFNKSRNHLKEFFDSEIEIAFKDKFIVMDVYTKKLQEKYDFAMIKTESPTQLLIGQTPKETKLYDLKNGHILVGGTTGSGKSTWERSAIVNLILNNTPDDLLLNLHDNKVVEYGIFKDSNMVKNFSFTVSALEKTLEMLEEESTKRYAMFNKENVMDITQWNEEHPEKKLKFIITFIAEFAQLAGYDRLMNALRKRLEMDRAAGLYYVISLQRGSKDLIPTNIKSNLDTRICFRTADSTNAWIILDQINTSELIKAKGRGILKEGGEMKDFQAMLLTSKQAIDLVKHTFTKERKENADRAG